MKQVIVLMGLFITLFYCNIAKAQADHSYTLVGLESKQVAITMNRMTSLIFPVGIKTGIKVSRDIAIQKVKGLENVLEVKALKQNFTPTNVSVYCVDGKLYSFELYYLDSPSIVNYAIVNAPSGSRLGVVAVPAPVIPVQLSGLPADEVTLSNDADSLARVGRFLHCRTSDSRMRFRLKGIYIKDSLMWMALQVKNASQVPYRTDYLRMYVIDKKRGKRVAVQQVTIMPVYQHLPEQIASETVSFTVGFPLFTIADNKKIRLELAELDGGRTLKLEFTNKTLLKARVDK